MTKQKLLFFMALNSNSLEIFNIHSFQRFFGYWPIIFLFEMALLFGSPVTRWGVFPFILISCQVGAILGVLALLKFLKKLPIKPSEPRVCIPESFVDFTFNFVNTDRTFHIFDFFLCQL